MRNCGPIAGRDGRHRGELVAHRPALRHPRFGMAMRQTIRRGRVIIPGHSKVGPPGTALDLLYGPIDTGWDLDAMNSMQVVIPDAPRADEMVLRGLSTRPARKRPLANRPDQRRIRFVHFQPAAQCRGNGGDLRVGSPGHPGAARKSALRPSVQGRGRDDAIPGGNAESARIMEAGWRLASSRRRLAVSSPISLHSTRSAFRSSRHEACRRPQPGAWVSNIIGFSRRA